MDTHTKEIMMDYIASLGEYVADYGIEINNISNRLIEKVNYLEDDVIRVELQKLENEAYKQLHVLQKAIEQMDSSFNSQLSSIELKILDNASNQIDVLNDIKKQLCTLIEEVERKTSEANKKNHENILMKMFTNQYDVMEKLEQNYQHIDKSIIEINNGFEKVSKQVRISNIVSSTVLGLVVGLVIYLFVIGVI